MANKIRCAHILVSKESSAKEILEKLSKGESFAKLAEQYSTDSSRKRGGDLGEFGRGMMVREFEKAAFSLQKGQISGIVKTQFGYHIIKRLS
jgi:parvulin-like peptidyl-prolyl isomerase